MKDAADLISELNQSTDHLTREISLFKESYFSLKP